MDGFNFTFAPQCKDFTVVSATISLDSPLFDVIMELRGVIFYENTAQP